MVRTVDRGRTRRAVALIEAIAAVIILGIALAAMLNLSSQALSSQRLGERLQTAAMLADERLSFVQAVGADDFAKRFPIDGVCDEPFTDFRYSLKIASEGGTNPYLVGVTISWQDVSRTRSIEVQTLLAPKSVPENQIDRQPAEPVDRSGFAAP